MTDQTRPVEPLDATEPTASPADAVSGNSAVGSAIVATAPPDETITAPTNVEVERSLDGPGGPVVEPPLPPLDRDAPHAPVPDTSDEALAAPTLAALGESTDDDAPQPEAVDSRETRPADE